MQKETKKKSAAETAAIGAVRAGKTAEGNKMLKTRKDGGAKQCSRQVVAVVGR